jgi:uncharacterized membrane protein
VLELGVPKPEAPGTLAHKLWEQWPSYAAYVVSFVTIGVIWINHHAMLRRVQTVDHSALVFNLLLLMLIARPELVVETIGPAERKAIMRRNMVGLVPYVIATAVAPLSSYLVLAICGAVALYYALPVTTTDG